MGRILSLNGDWIADYLCDEPYVGKTEPELGDYSDTVTALQVPGYWEDMIDLFDATGLKDKLIVNPMYVEQSYPQTGYCKDMFLPNSVGCLMYVREFEITELAKNTELYIGGAQNTVSAWINGEYLGRHEGYSTPFSFAIPEGVLVEGKNRVTLALSNNRLQGYKGRPVSGLTSRAVNECSGGIYGDVELRNYEDGLKDVWVTTSEDCKSFTVHTAGAVNCLKKITVFRCGNIVGNYEIPVGRNGVTVSSEGYELWSPESPSLYIAKVSTNHQEMVRSFGIRRLKAVGKKLFLNGEPYYFRGTCEHCYHPITVHPTRDKQYYLNVLRKLKSLGFNSIRFHTYIPPYEYMDAADELGMLFEVETPNNTSFAEWKEIVSFCRRYTCVNMYSTGNELQIDNDYEEHLRKCSELVHNETDALFSPMSAMRGVEYMLTEDDPRVNEPFEHNPARLSRLNDICDVYNSYSLGLTSYNSADGTYEVIEGRNAVYEKPLMSHEICIQGTYIDLSLEERYKGTRIGETAFMSSVRDHLTDKGLIDKADIYYRNSSYWQMNLRKHCFETVRRCESFAGYDFLGDIDTHWHTFGYCVGMMNEFYELKPAESVQNVKRYNAETVLLADLPRQVNFQMGQTVKIPILVSNYGKTLENAFLSVSIYCNGKKIKGEELLIIRIEAGVIKRLYDVEFKIPILDKPAAFKLAVTLTGENTAAENEWEIYGFPNDESSFFEKNDIVVYNGCSLDELVEDMNNGRRVVIFGTDPFPSNEVSYQLALAGRTNGHLATVINDSAIMNDFPHNGYCARQFEPMMNGSCSAVLDITSIPHEPIVDIASSYKNARREAMLFEYSIGNGKLLVCTFNLRKDDPAAIWLKKRILAYAGSEAFLPKQTLTPSQLRIICQGEAVEAEKNVNQAMNVNDITM